MTKPFVHITQDLPTDNGTKTISLTPKMLICVDAGTGPSTYRDDKPLSLSSQSYPNVLKKMGPTVSVDVPNHLSDDPDDRLFLETTFDVDPQHWPQHIIENVPALKELADICDTLQEVQRQLMLQQGRDAKAKLEELFDRADPALREALKTISATLDEASATEA